MSKVYFKRYDGNDPEVLSKIAKELFEEIVEKENVTLEKDIPIKVHFGEKGNVTYMPAKSYDGLIEALNERDIKTSYIETNVLYRGARTTRENHVALAKDHGFTQIPIIIADGEMGEANYQVEIDKEFFDKVILGKEYENYNQILVTSHFKGHAMAGFGGAIKQLAMGFAARSGKMAQHSKLNPTVKAKKCVSCGVCIDKCDVDAIHIEDHAIISQELCVGCAGCIAVCPTKAIVNDWNSSNFKEKIAEYAYGADLNKKHIYLNFLTNVTEQCDCIGDHLDYVANHIGVFVSMDPVAIDTACLDKLQHDEHNHLFDKGRKTLDHAKKIGFGSTEYELIEL